MAETAFSLGSKALDPLASFVVSHVEKVTGLGFEAKDLPGIDAKLQRRAASLGFLDLGSYAAYLKDNLIEETPHLIGLLTTHHTAFFREFIHFQELERSLIPRMLPFVAQRSPKVRLNVWSAAASRGQEAYSLAMFLEHLSVHQLASQAQPLDFSILATDIDSHSVSVGQNGVYLAREVNQSPAVYLGNHWARGRDELAGWMRAKTSLRKRIEFRTSNLLQPAPSLALTGSAAQATGKMDIIFCRNVFLYFRKEQIEQTIRYLLSQLEPWGVLCLGVCENLNEMNVAVSPLGHSIFVPKDSPHLLGPGAPKVTAEAVRPRSVSRTTVVRSGLAGSQTRVSAVPAESASRKVIRVLAVDDSPTVLALLKKVLTPADGFEVVATAKNLTEARAAVVRLGSNFDLMTLDLHLGNETGIDYLKSIPNQADHVPVVVVSGLNRESAEMAQAAIALGAADYVEKPEGNNLERMGQELRAKLSIASVPRPATLVATCRQTTSSELKVAGPAAPRNKLLSVVIVDDSPTMTRVLKEMIDGKGGNPVHQHQAAQTQACFRVVATVTDPKLLAEALRKHKPDVMTLDMNMPGINGVEVLRQLPPDLHVPAVVVSSLGLEQGSLVLEALAAGAVDYFPKPALQDLAREAPVLLEKLASASGARVKRKPKSSLPPVRRRLAVVPSSAQSTRSGSDAAARANDFSNSLILLGASTGGTEAIREVLATLPLDLPPICIVQHIPPVFSAAFAARLQDVCGRPVVEVRDGALLLAGHTYVSPGDKHFTVRRKSGGFAAALLETPKRGGHRPSVDVLFESAAELRGAELYGVLMTGMGKDGAQGLLKLRQRGAHTICQSESSCVVYGMPRAGVELGAAEFSEDLEAISARVTTLLSSKNSSKNSSKR
jgi:chemotaxis protein methyltransferase CheR